MNDEVRPVGIERELAHGVVDARVLDYSVGDHARATRAARDLHRVRVARAHDERAVGRQRLGEANVCRFVVRHVAVDIGVVELDARQYRRLRAVMQKLRALVEVGCVILVAFDHHVRTTAVAEIAVVVQRHAADEK